MNKYLIYSEKERVDGCVAVQYVSVARDVNHVHELASLHGVDLDGFEIELCAVDVRNELRKPLEPYFETEF